MNADEIPSQIDGLGKRERLRLATPDPRYERVRTDDGSWSLFDRDSMQTFHSESGALSESFWTYLIPVAEAWKERREMGLEHSPIRILEFGFGTGLSWELTCYWAWKKQVRLEYWGLEKYLLASEIALLCRLTDPVEELPWNLLEVAPPSNRDWKDIVESTATFMQNGLGFPSSFLAFPAGESIAGELRLLEKSSAQDEGFGEYDACYYDPFSPQAAPQFWTEEALRSAVEAIRPGGLLLTYCVARPIRDRLKSIGCEVTKRAGPPGGKREVLLCRKPRKVFAIR